MNYDQRSLFIHQSSSGCTVPFWRNIVVKLVMECCFFMTMPPFTSAILFRLLFEKIGFIELNHPVLFSRYRTCLDSYLFSNLKKFLRGKNFSRDDERIDTIEDYLNKLDSEFFCKSIQSLLDRW